MAKRIHKFTITQEQLAAVLDIESEDHSNLITVDMPNNAQILSLRTLNLKPRIFAIIDTDEASVARPFLLYPTGVDLPSSALGEGSYVGSFSKDGKTFHVLVPS